MTQSPPTPTEDMVSIADGTGYGSAPLLADANGALIVSITADENSAYLRISDKSTIMWRGEEKTIAEIIAYTEELENALAEAHLTSTQDG
jgi:hypothetical protein